MEKRIHPRHRQAPKPPRKEGAPSPVNPKQKEGPRKKPSEDKEKSGGSKTGLIIAIVILLLAGGGGFVYYTMNKPKKEKVEVIVKEEEPKSVIKPETKMIDISEYEMYQVQKGNYLYTLAKELYGDPKFWPLIYKANYTKLDNPDFLPKKVQLMVYELDSAATVLTSEDSLMLSDAYKEVALAYKKHANEMQASAYTERAKEFVPLH